MSKENQPFTLFYAFLAMNVSFLCNIYASCGGTGAQYDYIQRRPISVHSATR